MNELLQTSSFPITRLAILRTMGNLHTEPLAYDLHSLQTLVMRLAPDLLCADLTRETWESGDLSAASVEIQQALAPAIALTDTILLPVAPSQDQFGDYRPPSGIRSRLAQGFDRLMQWGQRQANSPEAIHGSAFEMYCHTVCALEEMTWSQEDRDAYAARSRALAENIVSAVARDPGGRVLVVVQCQWHHTLEPLLKDKAPWLEIVEYQNL